MLIIERFEDEIVILENTDDANVDSDFRKVIEIDRCFFPLNAREGDVVVERRGRYYVDAETTASRRSDVVGKLRQLGL